MKILITGAKGFVGKNLVSTLKNIYEVPAIFKLIAKNGNITEEMMYNTFNMGLGMIIALDLNDVDAAMSAIKEAGDECYIVGTIEAGDKGVTLC